MKGSVSPAQHLLRISAKTTGPRISGPPSVQSHNNKLFIVVMTTAQLHPSHLKQTSLFRGKCLLAVYWEAVIFLSDAAKREMN